MRTIRLNAKRMLFCLALVATLGQGAAAAEGKLLRWKFKAGQQWNVLLVQQSETVVESAGKPLKATDERTIAMTWVVDRVDAKGAASVIWSIDRMTVARDTGQGTAMRVDSASAARPDGEAGPIAGALSRLVGKRFAQQISSRGEILDAEPLALPAAGKPTSPAWSLRELVAQAAATLPNDAVQPGDSWNDTVQVELRDGVWSRELRYVYEGTEVVDGQRLEKISVANDRTLDSPPGRTALLVEGDRGEGVMYFDESAGRFVLTRTRRSATFVFRAGTSVRRTTIDISVRMEMTETKRGGR